MEDGDPGFESPIIRVGYAKIIEVWVEETEYQGFFRVERETNGNADEDLMVVLKREWTKTQEPKKVFHSGEASRARAEEHNEDLQVLENREMAKLKWTRLA
jgi:hypothetical protein